MTASLDASKGPWALTAEARGVSPGSRRHRRIRKRDVQQLHRHDVERDGVGNHQLDVHGVKRAEIESLFPGFSMRVRRITVAPPLGRMLGWVGPAVYYLAAQTRIVCTHYLCLMEKK